jgi:hypothetical protein
MLTAGWTTLCEPGSNQLFDQNAHLSLLVVSTTETGPAQSSLEKLEPARPPHHPGVGGMAMAHQRGPPTL